MYYWIIWTGKKKSGKLGTLKSGPYSTETRAQHVADDIVTSGRYDIVETRSRDWSYARKEVMAKLASKHKDISVGVERYYSTRKPVNKIEEEVSKPRFKRVGTGLLARRRKKRRLHSDEPDDQIHVKVVK